MLGAVALAGVLASVAVAYALYDLKRRRAEMSAGLRARVAGTLRAEPTLAGLPVVVDVHPSLRRDSPLTLEITGTVPTAEMRDAVLLVVAREVARSQPDARVDDRIVVDPSDFGQAHMVAPPRTLE